MQRGKVPAAFDCETSADDVESFTFQPSEVFLVARYDGGERRNGLFVANNPVGAVDPMGTWQFTIGGGILFGAKITFGNNGGKGWFNGQWNVGIYVGAGEGFFANLDPRNSGCHEKGRKVGIEGEGDIGLGPNVDVAGHLGISEGDKNWWEISPSIIPGTPLSGTIGSEGAKFPIIGAGEGTVVGVGVQRYF